MKDRPLWSSHKRISHNHFKIWHKSLNNFYFLFGQILLASFSWSLYISIKSLGWGPLTLEDSWQHQTFDQTEAEAVDEWQTSAKKAATNHFCKKATNHRCTRIGVILPKTSPWPERQVSSCAVKGKVQTNKSDQRFLGTISNWCHFHSFQLWECLKSLETFNCKPSFQGCTICPNWLYQSGTSYGLYDWW